MIFTTLGLLILYIVLISYSNNFPTSPFYYLRVYSEITFIATTSPLASKDRNTVPKDPLPIYFYKV